MIARARSITIVSASFLAIFIGAAPALASSGPELITDRASCQQRFASEKYCQRFFPQANSGPVDKNEIIRQANRDAGLPGGDFSDPIWLSPEIGSVGQGVGAQPWYLYIAGLAMLALFIALLFDWRNWRRGAHLDLLLLSAGLASSFVVYSLGHLGPSVWIAAASLLLLALRMFWRSTGRSAAGPLRPSLPTTLFLVVIAGLLPGRLLLGLFFAQVYDPGYSGALGAELLLSTGKIYGQFPPVVTGGDTYGPVNYYSYLPFVALFPLPEISAFSFDSLAAQAQAMFFDTALFITLLLIGRQITTNSARQGERQGLHSWRLGLILGAAYLAFPFSAFALLGATNDALPAFLLTLSFLFLLRRQQLSAGVSLAAATMAKFMPGLLAPLFSRPEEGWRSALPFVGAFIISASLLLLPTMLTSGPAVFWQETFQLQMTRLSPNSIWGQLGGISSGPLTALVIILAAAGFFFPRERRPALIAAYGAALLLLYQLSQAHWFYTYFIWTLPLILLSLLVTSARPLSGGAKLSARPAGRRPAAEQGF